MNDKSDDKLKERIGEMAYKVTHHSATETEAALDIASIPPHKNSYPSTV